MRILIIGGTGFIGPHVVRQLAAMGHEPIVFHRGNSGMDLPCEHVLGDWADLQKKRVKAEVAVNLILSSAKQASEFMNAMHGAAERVVVASSMDVYRACGIFHGSEEGELQPTPLTEKSDLRTKPQTYPQEAIERLKAIFPWLDDEYDKISVERTVMGDRGLEATVLRLPMIYGPGDYLRRFYPVLKRIDDGRRFLLFDEGHANWKSPRGYVENVAAAIVEAAVNDSAAGMTFNVCEQPAFSEIEWSRKIAAAANWDGEFVVMPRDTTPAHLIPRGNTAQHWETSSALIRDVLGYRELVSVDEGIRRTIAWDRANAPAGPLPYLFDYAAEDAAYAAYCAQRAAH